MRLNPARKCGDLECLVARYRGLDRTPTFGSAVSHHPFVAHGFARDNALAQAAGGGDDNLVAPTGDWIGGDSPPRGPWRPHSLHQYPVAPRAPQAARGGVALSASTRRCGNGAAR